MQNLVAFAVQVLAFGDQDDDPREEAIAAGTATLLTNLTV